MVFFHLKPFSASMELADAKHEYDRSQGIDRYKISEKAVFIPDGFGWKVLPKAEMKDLFVSHENVQGKGCWGWNEKIPAIRFSYVEDGEIKKDRLVFDRMESCQKMAEKLHIQ